MGLLKFLDKWSEVFVVSEGSASVVDIEEARSRVEKLKVCRAGMGEVSADALVCIKKMYDLVMNPLVTRDTTRVRVSKYRTKSLSILEDMRIDERFKGRKELKSVESFANSVNYDMRKVAGIICGGIEASNKIDMVLRDLESKSVGGRVAVEIMARISKAEARLRIPGLMENVYGAPNRDELSEFVRDGDVEPVSADDVKSMIEIIRDLSIKRLKRRSEELKGNKKWIDFIIRMSIGELTEDEAKFEGMIRKALKGEEDEIVGSVEAESSIVEAREEKVEQVEQVKIEPSPTMSVGYQEDRYEEKDSEKPEKISVPNAEFEGEEDVFEDKGISNDSGSEGNMDLSKLDEINLDSTWLV